MMDRFYHRSISAMIYNVTLCLQEEELAWGEKDDG